MKNNPRLKLNLIPEISGNEFKTRSYILKLLKNTQPSSVILSHDSNSIIAIYNGIESGKSIAFRADMDALPIDNGSAHLCGHDGHTAILLSYAKTLKNKKNFTGQVILIFQAEEETGKGAKKVMNLLEQNQIYIDYIFGYHNLPSFQEKQIILNHNIFASASNGLIIRLKGLQSHASEPEKGINPSLAIASLITMLNSITDNLKSIGFTQATIVHCKIGNLDFGISPAHGEIALTLRAYRESDLYTLNEKIMSNAKRIAEWHKLELSFETIDEFPQTKNNTDTSHLLKDICIENSLSYLEKCEPFKWSEDFGYYLKKYNGAYFGVGAGFDALNLHHPDYIFNDSLIPFASQFLNQIIKKLNP